MNDKLAYAAFEDALKRQTGLIVVPMTEPILPPEIPPGLADAAAIWVSGERPRLEGRPIAPDSIEWLETGIVENFEPQKYRIVRCAVDMDLIIHDENDSEISCIRRPLDGLTATITYRSSEGIGERLALTVHDGMEPDPIERFEFGPRTQFKESFRVPLSGELKCGHYVFVLWRTGEPTQNTMDYDGEWSVCRFFRRDELTSNLTPEAVIDAMHGPAEIRDLSIY